MRDLLVVKRIATGMHVKRTRMRKSPYGFGKICSPLNVYCGNTAARHKLP